MLYIKKILFFSFFSVLFFSCTCNYNKKSRANIYSNASKKTSYQQIVNKRYNANFNFFPNKENDFILCINQKKANNLNPYPPLQFCIFSIAENNIIYEQILENGNVEWIDDYKLKIINVPTQIKKDKNPDNVRIINVKLLEDK